MEEAAILVPVEKSGEAFWADEAAVEPRERGRAEDDVARTNALRCIDAVEGGQKHAVKFRAEINTTLKRSRACMLGGQQQPRSVWRSCDSMTLVRMRPLFLRHTYTYYVRGMCPQNFIHTRNMYECIRTVQVLGWFAVGRIYRGLQSSKNRAGPSRAILTSANFGSGLRPGIVVVGVVTH